MIRFLCWILVICIGLYLTAMYVGFKALAPAIGEHLSQPDSCPPGQVIRRVDGKLICVYGRNP